MPNKQGFTPGPWHVRDDGRHALEIFASDNRRLIGDVLFDVPDAQRQETEDNARLIAAAPDLLAALKMLLYVAPMYSENPRIIGALFLGTIYLTPENKS